MAKKTITSKIEGLPRILKVLIFFFLGVIMCPVYRIIRFTETKNILTLVAGIICCFGIGIAVGIIDAICELACNRVVLLAK